MQDQEPESTVENGEAAAEPQVMVEAGAAEGDASAELLAAGAVPSEPKEAAVHVAPDLMELVAAPLETEVEREAARQTRGLNEVVHGMLIVGLVVSTLLMLIGIGLELVRHQDLPDTVPDFGEIVQRVLELRPSGFLALGLLVLIATPILRVIGSIITFTYERDWRYAGITLVVFAIVLLSIVAGRG